MKARLAVGDGPLVHRAAAVDFMTYLVDDILVKVDRVSMLTSLEIRCPWLDPRIIELSFSRVPAALKVNGSERKILSKRAARRVLPSKLDLERKQGFSLPLDQWFAGEWGHRFESILIDSESIFEKPEIRKLFQLQRRGYPNSQRLFALGVFELWRRHYGVEWAG
jgi:asparagine synthase (glutamine-hydrolysing)